MECRLDGNTMKNGITSLVTKTLLDGGLFTQDGDRFTVSIAESAEAQDFVNGINLQFAQPVIQKVSDGYKINIPNEVILDYVYAKPEGKQLQRLVNLHGSIEFSPASWNKGEMFQFLNYPEVGEMTNNKLKSFLKTLNPNFRVEEIDNLSVEGVAYVKDFLIQVNSLSKFKAMPEEVAHVFRAMLPDDNPMKMQMFENITSFPIYSLTLNEYKDVYRTQSGAIDYVKIKWEAADKLVAEFVTAMATGDSSRVEALSKPKQGFIKRFINEIMRFLGFGVIDNTRAFADMAAIILSGENNQQLKTSREISDLNQMDSTWYKLTSKEAFERAFEIVDKKPARLPEIMSNAIKQFGRSFNEILKEDRYDALNTELKKQEDGDGNITIGKLNRLSEVQAILKGIKVDIDSVLDMDRYMDGVKQFLEALDRLEILSDGLVKVIQSKEKSKTFDEAIKNLSELEGYFRLFETFKNTISGEFAQSLVSAGVGQEVIDSIYATQSKFDSVNTYIITKQQDDLFFFYKEMLSETNRSVAETLETEIAQATKDGNKELVKKLKDSLKKLVVGDDRIIAMLSGRGTDIDGTSDINHLANAAILNGDLFVSGLAKYIQDKLNPAQQQAKAKNLALAQKIDVIEKQLGMSSEVIGKSLVQIEKVYDRETSEDREVVTYLNPFKNIQPALDSLQRNVRTAREERDKADRNAPEFAELDAKWKAEKKKQSEFLAKFMNRPYVREYYEFREQYDEDPIFVDAWSEYTSMSDRIALDESFLESEPENEDVWKELAQTKRERANLRNSFDVNGLPKTGLALQRAEALQKYFEESSKFRELDETQTVRSFKIAENRYKQKMAFALQQVRAGNPRTIKDVERGLRDQLDDPRLRIESVYNLGEPTDTIDYERIEHILLDKFLRTSIVATKNDAFYVFQKEVIDKINELKSQGELSPLEIQLAEAYEKKSNLLYGSRNEYGQINPDSLTEDQQTEVLAIEQEIQDLRSQRPKGGVVDPEEFSEEDRMKFEALGQEMDNPATSLGRRMYTIRERNKIVNKYRNEGKQKTLRDLYELLGEIQERKPTEYYWEKMTSLLPAMGEFIRTQKQVELSKRETNELNEFEADFILAVDDHRHDDLFFDLYSSKTFEDFLDFLKERNVLMYNWFVDYHSAGMMYDHKYEKNTAVPYVPSSLYLFSEPTREEHEKIEYNRKFQKYKVKNEYRTGYNPATGEVELEVGKHVTNRTNSNGMQEFLPLSPEQGEPKDSPYRNEEYYRMRDSKKKEDQLKFEYLQLLVSTDLENQEKVPSELRRWMQIPVMSLSHIESLRNLPQAAKEKLDYAKTLFTKSESGSAVAQEEGEDTLEEVDQLTQLIIRDKIPKLGMGTKTPVERVSRDLLKANMQFMFRAHEFEARSETDPIVKSLIRVMKDNSFKGAQGNKQRAKIFEKMYSQMILQEVPGGALNSTKMKRITKFLTANTGLRLAFDPVGGVINYVSAMVNDTIEAAAGKYLTLGEFTTGNKLALEVNASLVADCYKKSNLSLNTLMFNYFDMIQGEFEEDMLDRSSAIDKKASIGQIAMIPRKAGELMAQTAVAMGMLERVKVKNEKDGLLYPVHKMYKAVDNQMVLKEGFPEEWNPVTGKEFYRLKNKINRINLSLHGNYAKINQSEASRHSIGKLAENMKRWFMPAFQRRFGRESADISLEDIDTGYYRTAANAMFNIGKSYMVGDFATGNKWAKYYFTTPRQRQNLQRAGADIAQAFMLFLAFSLVLGYSGDDKNKNLDKNNWLHNMAILVTIRSFAETTSYMPIPALGFQELKRNALSPLSIPADAVSNFFAIGQLMVYQGLYWAGVQGFENDLYYSKDAGYWYQSKGDSKLLKYILRTAGYTGYTGVTNEGLDPKQVAVAIKTFDNLQKRMK